MHFEFCVEYLVKRKRLQSVSGAGPKSLSGPTSDVVN